MPKRTIDIRCTGAATARLEDLVPLQGKLKSLDKERYRKLKKALLDHGFSFPFFVWKRPRATAPKAKGNKHQSADAQEFDLCILDGHQRDRVLRRLKAQGYDIPPLPVDFIEAKDEQEARKKILLLSSQYGEMTENTLLEFLKESEIDLDDISDTVALPTVDVEKILDQMEEIDSGEQIDDNDDHLFQVVVECKDERQQLELIEKLEKQKYICRALIL